MKHRNPAFDALLTRGWLSLQPVEFRDAVIASSSLVRYEAGRTIFAAGDDPGGVVALVQGRLAFSIAHGATGPHLASLTSPGTWLGEGCFLTGAPRRVTIEAAVPCVIAQLPLAAMERLAAADPMNARRFGQIAMLNAFSALHALEDALIPQAERRLAAVLWRIVGGRDGETAPITQERLGQMANVSRKTTLKLLREFAASGALRAGYREIEVLDACRLRGIADGAWRCGGGGS